MTSRVSPKCMFCKHLHKDGGDECDAFPNGIPNEIWDFKFDHIKPYPEDNGIYFEPNENWNKDIENFYNNTFL